MKRYLKQWPVYLLLLSLFFVLHGFTENYNYIPAADAALLFLAYVAASIVLASIFWLVYRNISRASLLAFLCMFFFFFFGYIYDSINDLAPRSFFGKYSVLIGGFLLLLLTAAVVLLRWRKSMQRLNHVLNVFFLLLLLVEVAGLVYKMAYYRPAAAVHLNQGLTVCNNCDKPDIYLILTDAYAGEAQLKETMNFDNSRFLDSLRARGFHIPHSNSNYNYTPFSCASMLEMDYLPGLEKSNTSHRDLAKCYQYLDRNAVTGFLKMHGYTLHNFSIFDMWGQPSIVKETILPARTKFITAQTLFSRLYTNAIFNMAGNFSFLRDERLYYSLKSNNRALDSIKRVSSHNTGNPRFVYAHLIMPHYPYYFDKEGRQRVAEEIYDGKELDIEKYLEYLQYTNRVLLSLVDEIRAGSSKPPVIILVADHGFREYPEPVDPKYQFNNLLAVHLPNKKYSAFYDSISNVNVFRMLLNSQFNQRLSPLKDSSIFIEP